MQVTCDVRTVSWAMASLGVDRIDLLKIDVEGAELVSPLYIAFRPLVCACIIERHGMVWNTAMVYICPRRLKTSLSACAACI